MSQIYFILWSAAAIVSGIAHLVAPVFMAQGTSWPLAYGWQREIAFFDFAIAFYMLIEVRTRGPQKLATLLLTTACLSLFLGGNHLLSAVNGGWSYIHALGVAANAMAVAVGFWLLVSRRVSFGLVNRGETSLGAQSATNA